MAPQVFSAVTRALALLAGASAVDVPLGGDGVDVDGLNLLQTRASKVAKQGFFFWSQPEPSPEPTNTSLAETNRGGAAAVAATAAGSRVAAPAVKGGVMDKASPVSLETELTNFISNVKSPEFISHEAVQHIGQDCWEPCSKKGGLCAWCGAGNSCCRKGWDLNPSECTGVTAYKTKKHECVGPAAGAKGGDLMLNNSSAQASANASSAAAPAANATALLSANSTDLASGAATMNFTDNSTGSVHYHAGDANEDWRSLPQDGTKTPLSSWGFSVVSGLQSSPEMSRFISRLIESMHCRVANDSDYHVFLTTYANDKNQTSDKNQTYDNLVKELSALCGETSSAEAGGSWLERAQSQDEGPAAEAIAPAVEGNATEPADSLAPTEATPHNISLVSTSSDDVSLVAVSQAHQKMFLPEYIGESRVLLATEDEGKYLLDGSQVGAPPGTLMAYRNTKNIGDKHESYDVGVGTVVEGVLRDGWLEVEVAIQN